MKSGVIPRDACKAREGTRGLGDMGTWGEAKEQLLFWGV